MKRTSAGRRGPPTLELRPDGGPVRGPFRAGDRGLAEAVAAWFAGAARPLPWRVTPRDPYRSLVSEFMLQQTQVSRVLEKFGPFVRRFPNLRRLAGAPEGDVLAAWSGLGYYRRARNLHAAARAIAALPGGRVPRTAAELRALPGIGRYTAGALASIVFGERAAVVDGNVARVLLRLGGRELAHGSAEAMRWSWGRAEALVAASGDPGALNEGLMELGATVCTPRRPRCGECPLARRCAARREGRQELTPRPRATPARRPLHCASVLVRDGRGRVLVEPRPLRNLWAGLWQAPTLESADGAPGAEEVGRWLGAGALEPAGSFRHGTTHRDVVFHLWRAAPQSPAEARRLAGARPASRWLSPGALRTLPLSSAQQRILSGAALP